MNHQVTYRHGPGLVGGHLRLLQLQAFRDQLTDPDHQVRLRS